MAERVITYIDGFNLYFGLKAKGWRRFYWLDVALLADNLLKHGQHLVAVKYFTARISGPPEKQERQNIFLEATAERGRCTMYYGQYLHKTHTCPKCKREHQVPEEKMTDVNIAVEMMTDAQLDAFDTALVVSADSDLTPPAERIKELHKDKKVIAAFPPKRSSKRLASVVDANFMIGRGKLSKSLLPESITKSDGVVISRPSRWEEDESVTHKRQKRESI